MSFLVLTTGFLITFATGFFIVVRGCYNQSVRKNTSFFFGSKIRTIVTFEAMTLLYCGLAIVLDPTYPYITVICVSHILFAPLLYSLAFIPFRIGSLSISIRDRLIIGRLHLFYNRNTLDNATFRLGFESIFHEAQRGNAKSVAALDLARSIDGQFGNEVNAILLSIENELSAESQ